MKIKKYRPNFFSGFEDAYYEVNSKEELLESELCKYSVDNGYEICFSKDKEDYGFIMSIKPTNDEEGAEWWVLAIIYNTQDVATLSEWLPDWGLKREEYKNNQTNNKAMEKKIYVVTSGEYSDYGIDAVFTTKEKAVDYVEQHGTYYNIEEYILDEEVEKKTQLWYIMFCVEDGKLHEANPTSLNRDNVIDTCSIYYPFGSVRKQYICFYIDADSMDKAVKIASERFASVKANEYIWLRLTRPYELDKYGRNKFESFNIKTNEFIK